MNVNIYIKSTDEALFIELKAALDQQGQSFSEFVARAASKYLESPRKNWLLEERVTALEEKMAALMGVTK